MSISWVDVFVVLLAVAAGVSGWRHGLAVALLSFVGVLGGAVLGVRLAPLLVQNIESPSARVILSIVVVVLFVALGETTGVYFGRRIRNKITGERTLKVDSALGSVLQAVTVVVTAWLVALPLASASLPGLASSVRSSAILQSVDSVMPTTVKQLPMELRQLLNNSGFPDVLSPFAQTPITAVGPPNTALANSQVVTTARQSVVKVRGRAPSCSRQLEGTGFVIGPQAVLTNAHVVAGTSTTTVEMPTRGGRGRELAATVVFYNPKIDLAVLAVPDLQAPALEFAATPASPGDDAIVLGYPLDGPFFPTAAKVRQQIALRGPDIYDSGTVTRDVYTIRAVVRSGNSGGPMISPTGRVLGVVFGAALDTTETGFVLTAQQVSSALSGGSTLDHEVTTGSCAA